MLKCRWCPGQAKGHSPELELPMMSLKRCLVLILWCHSYLVKTSTEIQGGEPSRAMKLIQKFIDDWNWKASLDSQSIEMAVDYTKMVIVIFFLTRITEDENSL